MADKKAKIGAKIELDGEREYKQAIKDIAKEQSVLRSEMKLVAKPSLRTIASPPKRLLKQMMYWHARSRHKRTKSNF